MNKRFITITAAALVLSSSSTAFAQVIGTNVPAIEQQQVAQQVTKPAPLIGASPVRVEGLLASGPVKTSRLATGPIIRQETPELGSVEWLAQEKAEKDKLKSDAELRQEELEAEIARLEKVARDTKNLNRALALTKRYVGKTWYVYSGSTPDGWDCSGLVLWTYGHVGVELYHRASVQKNSGELVTEPKIGDIVAFSYKGSTGAFHVGIVTGPDEMIHAGGRKGDRTEVVSISRWAKGNGNVNVTYTRLIETNN